MTAPSPVWFITGCRALALDVTNSEQVKSVVAQTASDFDRLDVVVNNAGFGLVGAFEELGVEQIARNFDTNFFGALAVIRAVLPILRAQQSGHIVNISAAAVIANYAGFSIYGATKWALEGPSESLAAELKPLGIKVTIVQPGPFRTDFIRRSLAHAESHIADYDRTSGKPAGDRVSLGNSRRRDTSSCAFRADGWRKTRPRPSRESRRGSTGSGLPERANQHSLARPAMDTDLSLSERDDPHRRTGNLRTDLLKR
jgi:NAD(P)-dependent dehydrogenase (short-subunit alcohol dehydrogenase family)